MSSDKWYQCEHSSGFQPCYICDSITYTIPETGNYQVDEGKIMKKQKGEILSKGHTETYSCKKPGGDGCDGDHQPKRQDFEALAAGVVAAISAYSGMPKWLQEPTTETIANTLRTVASAEYARGRRDENEACAKIADAGAKFQAEQFSRTEALVLKNCADGTWWTKVPSIVSQNCA